ncbi:uncharacterized protein LOC124924987 [Impatiens glandulifera]|uniref:uncharacterized protein LOC124924987 n=1 Tax=Impatiens glandulifera TaxID=253017 RepID=UPI001FB100FC|nr:uncharacterized protein LOC124924987 [Impatiens glandulifera]
MAKQLEINVIAARGLAQVSKLMKTYVVAWIDPNEKLTTSIDHNGNTNPTWNYRFIFRSEDMSLSSDHSTVTFEIYNISFLRDIPIGVVCVPINSLVSYTNTNRMENENVIIPLPIQSTYGIFQGTLYIDINFIDLNIINIDSPLRSNDLDEEKAQNKDGNKKSGREVTKKKSIKRLISWRSKSDKSMSKHSESSLRTASSSIFSGPIFGGLRFMRAWSKKTSEARSPTSFVVSPLPTDVASKLGKGWYSSSSSIGSSILENWTLLGDRGEEDTIIETRDDQWRPKKFSKENKRKPHKNSSSKGGQGLLSCFGNLCGYDCNIICGSGKGKKKKRKS